MRRVFIACAFLLAQVLDAQTTFPPKTTVFPNTTAFHGWGIIQVGTPCHVVATTCNVSLTISIPNSTIVTLCGLHYSGTCSAPTDTSSNSFSVANANYSDSANGNSASYYARNVAVATDTITCNFSNTTGFNMCIPIEIVCPLGCLLDKTPSGFSGSTNPWTTTTTGTLSQAVEVAIAFGLADNSNIASVLPGTGWATQANASYTGGGLASEYQTTNATTALTGSITVGNVHAYVGQIVTFE